MIAAGDQVPLIPFVEVAGRAGAAEPRQRGPIWTNDGVTEVVTVMLILVVVAHWPAAGVNVYVLVPVCVVLITDGLHVPDIGGVSIENEGSAGGVLFWQRGPIWLNDGTIAVVTVISAVAETAH